MKAEQPQSYIIAGIIPEFPVGTVVEIKNNVDTIPLEDRLGIVREYFLKNVLTGEPYIAYHVELVSKPGVFRLRTQQFLKAANMPTKQPVPPPKFNIRDEVIYKQLRYKVTNRKYIASNWVYSVELNEPSSSNLILALPSAEIKESALELAPPSKLVHPPQPKFMWGDTILYKGQAGTLQAGTTYNSNKQQYEYEIVLAGGAYLKSIPENELQKETPPRPEPKYKVNERVICGPPEDEVYITSIHPFDEVDGWKYTISRYSGTGGSKLLDYGTNIPEYIIKPYPPQETTTVVNEQGGKQSHLDARFDCIPPVVLRLLAQCLGFGARKYGKDNWKKIPQWDHLNHAMNHINEWNRGNRDEPHLVNAMARLTFALWQAVDSKDQPDTYLHPDDTK